ncbi:ribosome biogenesis GTP-binding protein YihA/YsxC [Alphaproteobacteria bacterium]|nr:ribosome biogenesis GTP-binding protein YihA/YsxC [Alphaproteobacteria bacterium]
MLFENVDIEKARKLFSGECNFIAAAVNSNAVPDEDCYEIAFAGRSNVGKSSLVNALTNRKTLARTSQTPGRTRQLIFFELQHNITKLRLVDLPGYGYAKAPKKDIQSWTSLTVRYLKGRPSLRTICLLIDSRRGIGVYDELIMKELDKAAVSWIVILTKSDKLSVEEIEKIKDSTIKKISKYTAAYPEILVTSSLKSEGIPTLRTYLASLA